MPRSNPYAVIGDADGIDCLLCDARHDTIEAHATHHEEVHNVW